jgi:hypothetical protein
MYCILYKVHKYEKPWEYTVYVYVLLDIHEEKQKAPTTAPSVVNPKKTHVAEEIPALVVWGGGGGAQIARGEGKKTQH